LAVWVFVLNGNQVLKVLIYILIVSSTIFAKTTLSLSDEEKTFLQNHPVIKVTGQKDWPPFDFMIGQNSTGYSVDMLELIANKTGIKFEFVNGYAWKDLWQMFMDKEIDIAGSVAFVPSRMRYGIYTHRIYSGNTVYITQKETPVIDNIKQLYGKTFAAPKGWKNAEYIRKHHPLIKLFLTNDGYEALQSVKEGRAYATTNMDAVAYYILKKEMLTDLKINSLFSEFNDGINQDIHFMVRKDYALLASIMNKALDAITLEESEKLQKKWFGDDILQFSSPLNNPLGLTKEEFAYLKNKKVLKVSSLTSYAPYDFIVDGVSTGYSTDYMRLIADKIGIEIKFITDDSWEKLLEKFCNKELDILHATDASPIAKNCGLLSPPQIKDTRQFITRKNNFKKVNNLADLVGYTFAHPKGWSTNHMEKYKDKIKIIDVENIQEAIEFVRQGKADFTAASSNVLHYIIAKNGYENLLVQGYVMTDSDYDSLYISSRNDEPLLQTIIKKAMNSISLEERNKLSEKWFGKDKKEILTYEEKLYLDKKNMTLCIDPIWEPIDYINKDGKHAGIGSFFIQDIEKAIGKKFQLLASSTWSETFKNIQAGKCDVVSLIQKSTQREKYLDFTAPYFTKQSVFITKKEVPYIEDIALLKDQKIGIVKDFILKNILKENYKNLILQEFDTLEEGLLAVEKGEIFGFVDLASTATYIIQKRGLNLKISGNTGIALNLSLGVKKGDSTLFSIINKGLHTIDEATRLKYSNLYSHVTYEKIADYSLVWKIASLSILLISIFLYWNRKLHLAKKEIENKNRELDKLLLIQSRQATFGTMIDTISHQWKQPLNELGLQMMHLDTQLQFYKQVPSKEMLGSMVEKSNNILEFMSRTIDIFRNFFKTSEDISDVNISQTLNNTILFLESTFEVENIKITKNIEPHIVIKALEEEFAHSILNILVNAKDIFKERNILNPSISIQLYTHNKTKCITIEDNAGGIQVEPIETIFQAGASTKPNGGVGLFICKKIIEEKLNGTIKVENGEKGAKFTIKL
jgi:ABC-type amino acid transport substrate-binding protein/nitrogen-specific signal transduction histidine kinase